MRAVVDANAEGVLAAVGRVASWTAIREQLDAVVEANTERCRGCPLGSLAPQPAETDEQARIALATSLMRWSSQLRDGLRAMERRGDLADGADPERLATATLAAVQEGGLILTQGVGPHATPGTWPSPPMRPTLSSTPTPGRPPSIAHGHGRSAA